MPLSSFFWIFLKKKSKKMIDNDFNHVYTGNVNKRPVPQNKSSALILFFDLCGNGTAKKGRK